MSRFERAEAVIGMVLLVAIVCMVFAAGILRKLGYPIIWGMDMAQLLFIWVSFIGADLALRRKVHIGMDLAVRPAPPRLRSAIEVALALVIVVFLGILVVIGIQLTLQNPERQFGDSGISYAFVTSAVPAGCLLLASTICWRLFAVIRGWRQAPGLVFTDQDQGEPEDQL